uniref:MARVEL domain-containing protein n=1 Tax=Globodera pallida TaxID=36090 RepID=A0A183BVM4_GLOPA
MDNESDATNNESVAANNESVAANNESQATTCCDSGSNEIGATNNQSVAINKGHATTCCGSGSNEIGATNKYKYGPNNNKSGKTCCCGCVSIETGTYVAAMVVCVIDMLMAIFFFFLHAWEFGIASIFEVCICLLVVFAQHARNPWLFVPYLILGAFDLICRGVGILASLGCLLHIFELFSRSSDILCICLLGYFAVSLSLFGCFYSIILRGFLAVREVESRRYRPHF